MSKQSSVTVDDDFTMEVLEVEDDDEECTVVTIGELEDTKPAEAKKELPLECNGLAIPMQTKKEFKRFLASHHKPGTKSKEDPVKKAALEFKTLSILQEYKDMISEGFLKRPYECPTCHYKSDRFCVMLSHVNNHLTQQKEYRCSVCNYTAFSKGNLTLHRARCVYKYKKSCPHCSFVTVRNKTFRRHLLRHTAKFSCASCKFYTNDDEEIEVHKKNCTKWAETGEVGEKCTVMAEKCDVCDFRDDNEIVVAQHTEEKHLEYEVKCGDCEFVTVRKKWLTKHRQQSHRTWNMTLHKCDECDYTSFIKSNIRNHMRKHRKK